MHVPQSMKDRVTAHLEAKIRLGKSVYPQMKGFKFPTVLYTKRGTTAGTANYGTWTINLNSVLLMENDQKFIDRTVTHELAHLITDTIYPHAHERKWNGKRNPHGPEWQEVMVKLGADPSRCHSYDTTNSRVKKRGQYKYLWTCQQCGAEMIIGSKRHSKMKSGISRYWMRGCSSRHTYKFTHVIDPNGKRIAQDHLSEAGRSPGGKVEVKAKPAPARRRRTLPGASKKDQAILIYRELDREGRATRQNVINAFMARLGMSKAGASTYQYNTKKALGL